MIEENEHKGESFLSSDVGFEAITNTQMDPFYEEKSVDVILSEKEKKAALEDSDKMSELNKKIESLIIDFSNLGVSGRVLENFSQSIRLALKQQIREDSNTDMLNKDKDELENEIFKGCASIRAGLYGKPESEITSAIEEFSKQLASSTINASQVTAFVSDVISKNTEQPIMQQTTATNSIKDNTVSSEKVLTEKQKALIEQIKANAPISFDKMRETEEFKQKVSERKKSYIPPKEMASVAGKILGMKPEQIAEKVEQMYQDIAETAEAVNIYTDDLVTDNLVELNNQAVKEVSKKGVTLYARFVSGLMFAKQKMAEANLSERRENDLTPINHVLALAEVANEKKQAENALDDPRFSLEFKSILEAMGIQFAENEPVTMDTISQKLDGCVSREDIEK